MEENNAINDNTYEYIGRNGFITFWLWLLIIVGSLSAIYSSYKIFDGVFYTIEGGMIYSYTALNNGYVLE